ncbi:hypothetical protein [Nocardioides bruguierae]|uniref:hypothetical protein n=1 Tax=Nocardioides bruguierae TaxID=2945102 RepID=UPI0020219E4F|nr:hypothetical protein [Nocardioides bruguierae]MCL8027145.1 hypothetical protein [Nocardioides bruguierae]
MADCPHHPADRSAPTWLWALGLLLVIGLLSLAINGPGDTAGSASASSGVGCGTFALPGDGGVATVSERTGGVSCEAALRRAAAYYADAPTQGRGSGGYVRHGAWVCGSATRAVTDETGRLGTCQTLSGRRAFRMRLVDVPEEPTAAG